MRNRCTLLRLAGRRESAWHSRNRGEPDRSKGPSPIRREAWSAPRPCLRRMWPRESERNAKPPTPAFSCSRCFRRENTVTVKATGFQTLTQPRV